jgi:hypothetical protein
MSVNRKTPQLPLGRSENVRGSLTPSNTPKNPPAPTNLVPMTPKPTPSAPKK